jgi:tetratricopeptide (TPR) repeat protein
VQGWTDDPDQSAREALGYTARALDLDPNHTQALVCEGQVLTHLAHRLDDAAECYDRALLINPNDAQGRALRGMLEAFRDNGQAGKRDTERALHLTPLDPHRFFYLVFAAAANLTVGDFSRAEMLAKESLRLNRTHTSTLRTLAAAQVGLGKTEQARDTAKRLLSLQPDLRVSRWLSSSPSANYKIGQRLAGYLRAAGIPD